MSKTETIFTYRQFVKRMTSGQGVATPDGGCPVGVALNVFRGRQGETYRIRPHRINLRLVQRMLSHLCPCMPLYCQPLTYGTRAKDNCMASFGEPPIVVNCFYHEQVKKSARGNLPFR